MQHDSQRLAHLIRKLSETLVTAACCADELRDVVQKDAVVDLAGASAVGNRNGRPLLDESTFCVIWRGRSLRLGHTRSFWLLARLARRPNQYVTHLDLLNDVWDDDGLTTATIRSTICQLRKRLCRSGMKSLAKSIRGHNGHYMLSV